MVPLIFLVAFKNHSGIMQINVKKYFETIRKIAKDYVFLDRLDVKDPGADYKKCSMVNAYCKNFNDFNRQCR
jgi:hypothetical protein